MVIFIIRDFQAESGCVADKLVASFDIFIKRNDVRVAEEKSRTEPLFDHPFQDGGRTRSTAAMQQDAVLFQIAPIRNLRPETASFEMSIHLLAKVSFFVQNE